MAVHETRAGAERAVDDRSSRSSLVGLVNRLFGEIQRLLDQKLTLLKLELTEELAATARRSALLAGSGLVAGLGGLLLIMALAIWLGELLASLPGGFAIVGGILALGGLILLPTMRRQLSQQRFVPRETVQELRRDIQWIKHEL